MSQLREYLEKHPSETQRMLGIDYDQLIQLIPNAENMYARQKEPINQRLKKESLSNI
ncbi:MULTISPECIES: hypothetical protein [unclassified Microcoleus]|uniref:hypothetical protein n=1 Tax=unclassified Microcoleus TaxID=2642155 RepID=UPI0025DEB11C|nr:MULTISPECIES: hypothetical protein [unclassified Microcoleus]